MCALNPYCTFDADTIKSLFFIQFSFNLSEIENVYNLLDLENMKGKRVINGKKVNPDDSSLKQFESVKHIHFN